jgi:hypothetical protein
MGALGGFAAFAYRALGAFGASLTGRSGYARR